MPDESIAIARAPSPAALEYGSLPRGRTRWFRLIFLVVITFVVAMAMPHMWTEFGYRVGRRAEQREMMSFAMPPGTVAVGPNAVPKVSHWQTSFVFGLTNGTVHQVTPFFSHERTSRGGTRRIVGAAMIENDLAPIEVGVASSEIASIMQSSAKPSQLWVDYKVFSRFQFGEELKLNVQFGQPDPIDASRFTVFYSLADQTGTLVGELQDDGTVTLTAKDGPLAKK